MEKQTAARHTLSPDGWRLYRGDPGSAAHPDDLDRTQGWDDAVVPGTVANTILAADSDLHHPSVDIDQFDWWYESTFTVAPDEHSAQFLRLEGLATTAQVWLNGTPVHSSDNMFRTYRVDVSKLVEPENQLTIVFRSLAHSLKARRPRPRWKTNLVNHQQLRWLRTTLLGRIPGWTPPIRPVGPWRPVLLEMTKQFDVTSSQVLTTATNGVSGISVDLAVTCTESENHPQSATLSICGREHNLELEVSGSEVHITGTVQLDGAARWWPHTHGDPNLHPYEIRVASAQGNHTLLRGSAGFRDIQINRSGGKVELRINGRSVFARGGCWTSNDIVSLAGDTDALRRKLSLLRDAGANLIRVGGTMVYESDLFYELCDELGILVWQDLMLANMDYPSDDEDFAADLHAEITEQVRRIGTHPCATVFCGGSEVEQQAAMFGMTKETWTNPLYYETIPSIIDASRCSVPYFPSSPSGGPLPFHNATGIAHYFGVGAYKQPLADLGRAHVKFASECLAFSNVPDDATLKRHFGSTSPATHGPVWKAGVPRDASAGWDFEDIRDHYIQELYGVDPTELRYADNARYIAISQVVTGEIMEHVFSQWRSDQDDCGGGLIWWLNDIVPGAGWGMLDSDGHPKPLYYFLRRCWKTLALSIDDRGLDGMFVRINNESSDPIRAELGIRILQHANHPIAQASAAVTIEPASTKYLSIDQLLGRFLDTSYSYRFGPPKHDVVIATLVNPGHQNPLVASCYPGDRNLGFSAKPELNVETETDGDQISIRLQASYFLKGVKLQSAFYEFDDNYFDLPPDTPWQVTARARTSPAKVFRATLSALNLEYPLPIG